MDDDSELLVPVKVTQRQIDAAVAKAVQTKTDELMAEFRRTIELKVDDLRRMNRDLEDRVVDSRDRVDDKIKDVDNKIKDLDLKKTEADGKIVASKTALDTLQENVNKRVNTYVIPSVIIVLAALIFAIFSAAGGFDMIEKMEKLKKGIETAETQFNGAPGQPDSSIPDRLKALDNELTQLKAKTDTAMTAADAERYNALQKQYNDLAAQFAAFKAKNAAGATATGKSK